MILQEDIESRTVALSVNAAKMTGQLFKTAVSKYLAYRKSKQRDKSVDVTPHGKQSVKQLIGQNQGVSTIESNDPHIRDFDRVARKYGVDYAIKKVKEPDGKPKYVIFFKARDADALTQAFTEYTRKSAEREKKPSVRAKLRELAEKVKDKVLERTQTKQRGQEL